jgi:hypothetical protein
MNLGPVMNPSSAQRLRVLNSDVPRLMREIFEQN